MVDPIVYTTCLTKVLMDGDNGLNVLYAKTLDAMGIGCSQLRQTSSLFYEVILGQRALPPGQINLPVTIGTPSNYQKEVLTFEVVRFHGAYDAILGRPCYAKFMVVPI